MKQLAIITMVMLLTALAGCNSKEHSISEKSLPKVNDQNCRPEKIAEVTPDEARERFASLCLRRTTSKPSDNKAW